MASTWETFKLSGEELLGQVKRVLAEGNARRVVITQGPRTIAEFPLTVGLVGALAAPMLGAIGALAALLTNCSLHVERTGAQAAPAPPPATVVVASARKKKKAARKRARAAA
jgi:uncharacterized protein DUF4342